MNRRFLWPLLAAAALTACATPPAPPVPAPDTLVAVSVDHKLVRFNAARPGVLQSSLALRGLKPGEQIVGIDYRVARGELYALADSGQLYRVDVDQALLTPVGEPVPLPGGKAGPWGVDFNPTVDRLRVVNAQGFSLRRHPDTGAQVDGDPNTPSVQPDGNLRIDPADGTPRPVRIVAVGYTYNKNDEKLTTNYAIDAAQGRLMVMGSVEGQQPVVSPNTGRLRDVGPLGIPAFQRAHFDIADVRNTAYLSASHGAGADVLYRVDLSTGQATRIGPMDASGPLRGLAVQP
jgi:hypothetical protein